MPVKHTVPYHNCIYNRLPEDEPCVFETSGRHIKIRILIQEMYIFFGLYCITKKMFFLSCFLGADLIQNFFHVFHSELLQHINTTCQSITQHFIVYTNILLLYALRKYTISVCPDKVYYAFMP